jgi:hypothetical protein
MKRIKDMTFDELHQSIAFAHRILFGLYGLIALMYVVEFYLLMRSLFWS